MTRYAAQWVRYLDKDLEATATRLANKPGNKTVGEPEYYDTAGLLPGPLPGFADQQGLTRLVLIAHGDPARKERERNLRISVAEPKNPTEVASIIQAWLGGGGKKVDRISLHVCWGAGRQYASKDDGSRGAKMHRGIMPRDSFAWALAKYCGELAGTITARNVALGVAQDGKRVGTYFRQTVRGFPARNYHNVEPFEKYVFTPDPVGTLDAPKDPKFEPAGPAPD